MSTACVNLQDVVSVHQSLLEHRNAAYINLIQQINTRTSAIIKDDLGSQFVQNCGRDLAGEVVRNFFDTSDYNITVDQLAMRILKFTYEDEYDPLADSGSGEMVKKNVYNYNELRSSELDRISDEMHHSQEKLFSEDRQTDNATKRAQKAYRQEKTTPNGTITDELTNQAGTTSTFERNGQTYKKSDLQADHRQARESATYNSHYLSKDGAEAMRQFWNSSDNFQMMHASANASKGDIRVCNVNGKIKYVNARSKEYDAKTDITYKATPEQLADAVCMQWESVDKSREKASADKIEKLKETGYLNEDGKVPKSVRQALIRNIKHSQNKESITFLQNADYGQVAEDAATMLFGGKREEKNTNGETTTVTQTKGAIGKIIAGQIIYYAAPPLVYEVRTIIQNRHTKLDSALDQLGKAAHRVGDYVFSKIKDIFSNVLFSSLKKFIKSFMDILINAVKATVKKLLKIAKNLVLSTVDAVRIIADKNASPAEKADSVFNLFGITITSCVVEVLFELAADALRLPEPFDDIVFGPLQILTTVICTNLTMLILQKADLFDVRFGFKINAIKNIFAEEYAAYEQEMAVVEGIAESEVQQLLQRAREDCMSIYTALEDLNPRTTSAQPQLNQISRMFNVYIDYDEKWAKFTGQKQPTSFETTSSPSHDQFIVNYENNKNDGLAAAATYYYFTKLDPKIKEVYPFDIFALPQDVAYEAKKMSTITPFIFYEVKKHLENISDESLDSIISMVDAFMASGAGGTAAKNSARAIFDKYVATRKRHQ